MLRTIVLILIFFPLKVWSQSSLKSCLPDLTSAQLIWSVNSKSDSSFVHSLSSHVQLVGEQSGKAVEMRVRFDPEFNGVSLPYNLYAVMVISDGAPVAWWDFTNACVSPGVSFFPGREFRLPKVNLVGGESERLQIMVWGRL